MKEETDKNLWYLDSGCSNHMSGDKSVFSVLDESFRDSVKFGNNSKVAAMGKGQVLIQTNRDYSQTIMDVLFVPDLKTNLLSIGQLQVKIVLLANNLAIHFHKANLGEQRHCWN